MLLGNESETFKKVRIAEQKIIREYLQIQIRPYSFSLIRKNQPFCNKLFRKWSRAENYMYQGIFHLYKVGFIVLVFLEQISLFATKFSKSEAETAE